jgi:hypothetical protein
MQHIHLGTHNAILWTASYRSVICVTLISLEYMPVPTRSNVVRYRKETGPWSYLGNRLSLHRGKRFGMH